MKINMPLKNIKYKYNRLQKPSIIKNVQNDIHLPYRGMRVQLRFGKVLLLLFFEGFPL